MSDPKEASKRSPASRQQPREIELKLELASGTADPLLRHPSLANARPVPEQSGHLHATYFDTDDHALHRAGISLRIRRRDGVSIQTIKAEQETRGLAIDRGEWEKPVDDRLDFSAAEGTPLASLLPDEDARKRVKPLFTIETERQAFEVQHNGAVIEMAVDRAEATAADRSLPFSEVELELKKGESAALFVLARELSTAAPLRLSPVAKSERGYRLVSDGSVRPFRADKIRLPQEASCAEAFQITARSCLGQMVLNEALVRQTRDSSALHQMRVGLRRLRAAISLFKNQLLTDRESESLRNDLRWAGQQLGAARDLDVFLERLRDMEDGEYDPSQLEVVEQQRMQAYEDLLEALESRRFMDIVLQTAAWIEAGDWTRSETPGHEEAREHPSRDFAARELARRWKRIRKLAKLVRDLDDEERHELRIRIKKLRYGAEFFASLFPSERALKRRKNLLTILEDLQETLGELNDLAVGGSLVPSLAALSPERMERRREKLLGKAESASGKLAKTKPFWE